MNTNREDYIKSIYELGGFERRISNKSIADDLEISAPSVSEMIQKLVDEGLLNNIKYKGVKLTKLGIIEARKIRRRHLLWEVFLVDKLGYDWKDVNEEAEKLEHVMSLELEERLDKYLDYPKYCPHGSAIRLDDVELNIKKITDLKIGDKVQIIRVLDEEKIIDFMDESGLKIGDWIELKSIEENSIMIRENNKDILLNDELIEMIFVS